MGAGDAAGLLAKSRVLTLGFDSGLAAGGLADVRSLEGDWAAARAKRSLLDKLSGTIVACGLGTSLGTFDALSFGASAVASAGRAGVRKDPVVKPPRASGEEKSEPSNRGVTGLSLIRGFSSDNLAMEPYCTFW